jgi:hypothetical protein
LLHQEIINCLKKPNHASLLCQAFESGNRYLFLQQGNKILEEYVSNICKILKLSPGHCVSLAESLTHSQHRQFALDSYRILTIKLPEVMPSGSLIDISEESLLGILQLLSSSEVLHIICIIFNFFSD